MGRRAQSTEQVQETQSVEATDVGTATAELVQALDTAPAPSNTPKSIRSLIRSGLLAGDSTKTIAERVVQFFPDSAAARKSVKHIAFYRSLMRKAGELPKRDAAAAPVVPEGADAVAGS